MKSVAGSRDWTSRRSLAGEGDRRELLAVADGRVGLLLNAVRYRHHIEVAETRGEGAARRDAREHRRVGREREVDREHAVDRLVDEDGPVGIERRDDARDDARRRQGRLRDWRRAVSLEEHAGLGRRPDRDRERRERGGRVIEAAPAEAHGPERSAAAAVSAGRLGRDRLRRLRLVRREDDPARSGDRAPGHLRHERSGPATRADRGGRSRPS